MNGATPRRHPEGSVSPPAPRQADQAGRQAESPAEAAAGAVDGPSSVRHPASLPPGWAALAGLAAVGVVLHLLVVDAVLRARAPLDAGPAGLQRMEVAFVRELRPMAPLSPPAAAPAPVRSLRAVAAAPAAGPTMAELPAIAALLEPAEADLEADSATDAEAVAETEPERDPEFDSQAVARLAADEPAVSDGRALDEPLVAAAVAGGEGDAETGGETGAEGGVGGGAQAGVQADARAAAEALDDQPPAEFLAWPPSTRLSYVLTGNYRGPIDGRARVEWLRSGTRYQVHLDLGIGPSFAPLASRRLSSEGRIGEAGLIPRRYEEETRIAFREPQRWHIALDPQQVTLPSGRSVPRPEGVQDSASQFVQMTWLFTTDPTRLQPGQTIELPLALPRRVEPWLYDVQAAETLFTPIGPIEAVHVRPRREARPGGDLTAEFWVAPTLQYLPVRIVIRQSAEVWLDLLLERLPQQAEGGAAVERR
jgi:hypothetical protein